MRVASAGAGRIAVGAAIIVLAAPACGVVGNLRADTKRHGSSTQEELARIVAGYPATPIEAISTGAAPHGYRLHGLWAFVSINGTDEFRYIYGKWQSLLAIGVKNDLLRDHERQKIVGVTFFRVKPRGSKQFDESGVIERPFRNSFAPIAKTDLQQRIVIAARLADLNVIRVQYLNVLNRLAAEITVRVAYPALFLNRRDRAIATLVRHTNGGRAGPEGTYVRVVDARGTVVTTSGYSVRTGSGVGGTRAGLNVPVVR